VLDLLEGRATHRRAVPARPPPSAHYPALLKAPTLTRATDPDAIISQLRCWAAEQPELARVLIDAAEEVEEHKRLRAGRDRRRVRDALHAGNWTVADIKEATGLTDFAVRRELRRLVAEGAVRVDRSGRAELFEPI
jgi:hypothetical protein